MSAPGWRRAARVLLVVFVAAVAVLLVRYARSIRWREVGTALAGYDLHVLGTALVLVIVSYALYATYDVLARSYARHRLPTRAVMVIAGISYAFNLNLGALIGGAAFRFRLYSGRGLDAATITKILGFSVTTNWVGYIAVAGAIFATQRVAIPDSWRLGAQGLEVLGIALLVATAAYLFACAVAHDRVLHVRGHDIRLPTLRLAILQVAVAAANWLTIATIVFVLLRYQVPYGTVAGIMLTAAIAGAIAHIPAGLGVIEVVVLASLSAHWPEPELVAALLAYRALYYVAPLLVATALYLRFEAVMGVRQLAARRAGPPRT